MISDETMKKYRPTIGIECHVQLATNTNYSAVPIMTSAISRQTALLARLILRCLECCRF